MLRFVLCCAELFQILRNILGRYDFAIFQNYLSCQGKTKSEFLIDLGPNSFSIFSQMIFSRCFLNDSKV